LSNGAPSAFGGVTDPRQPELYLSYRQATLEQSMFVLLVRSAIDPMTIAPSLRAIVRDEDSSLVPESITTMDDRVLSSLARPRIYALLVGGFSACAVLIAGIGLFGVLACTTAQRTREIGVRTALGATPRDIVTLVARQAIGLAGAGLAVGLATAFVAVQSLSKILYGVSARDPWSFAIAPLVVGAAAAMACVIPAARAARIDPLHALRSG
jgi:ABC-type antimicrobial peptide transport system permease subunit